jgi:outer membrane protein OmpA-like peptidoglycan-associated protein
VRIGANVGALFREQQDFLNVSAGSELTYAAALGYRFKRHTSPIEVGGELNGGIGLTQTDAEELPLEGLLYLRAFLGHDWELQGGPGFGVLPGYGVPTWRAFVGVRWRPTSHDRDHDGIADDEDECPSRAEDRDRYEDLDGCPEDGPDEDKDGVSDYDDKCPGEKETINGVEDDDGCPDSGDPRVVYEDGELKILDRVRFEHGSATLEADSEKTLDQVALILKANPEFVKVEVEGHTDSTGPDDVNQRLSEQRANTVRSYLIGKGIDPGRLEARGYGETQPLEKGAGDKAMSENRRVEFVITESTEGE